MPTWRSILGSRHMHHSRWWGQSLTALLPTHRQQGQTQTSMRRQNQSQAFATEVMSGWNLGGLHCQNLMTALCVYLRCSGSYKHPATTKLNMKSKQALPLTQSIRLRSPLEQSHFMWGKEITKNVGETEWKETLHSLALYLLRPTMDFQGAKRHLELHFVFDPNTAKCRNRHNKNWKQHFQTGKQRHSK